LEADAVGHVICVMGLHLLIGIKIPIAPETKSNDWLAVLIMPLRPSFFVRNVRHVACAWLISHLAELLIAMLRAGEQLNRAFTVVTIFYGHRMVRAHAHGRLGATGQWSDSLSFTAPEMAFEIAKMSMHLRHLTDLIQVMRLGLGIA
jgi:hypothetical protein